MLAYATREQVKDALEIMETSRSNALIDGALEAARLAVEGTLRRRFYPEKKTIYFDWPNHSYAPSWTLELGSNEAISIVEVLAGGTDITAGVFLRRHDNLSEPPYSMLQVDLSGSSAFQSGDTFQRSIAATLLTGYNDTATSLAACALGGNINSSVTTAVFNPTSGTYNIGVGSIVLIGTERLITVDRRMSDTGQNLQSNMDDIKSDRIVDVSDGTVFAVGETILLGSERMRITDIAGNNLIVDRAWDGSTLEAHTSPVDVYALRTFTVLRGQLGTTAAAHITTDSVYTHEFPGLVNQLSIAEACVMLSNQASGWARQSGSGGNSRETAGEGLEDLRNLAILRYGRVSRSAAI